jgi:hypothetical protein
MNRTAKGTLIVLLPVLLWGCSGKDGDKDGGKGGGLFGANEAERRAQVQNDLRQIGLALHNYHDNKGALPSALHGMTEAQGVGWRVALLPYIEQDSLYTAHVQGRSPRQAVDAVGKTDIKLYSRVPGLSSPNHTAYRVFVGPGTPFEKGQRIRFAAIPDGLSNTIFVVEAAESVPWASDQELEYDPAKPLPKLGGHFQGGFFALMGDGEVRFISDTISETTLRAMITRNGNEVVDIP